jgi:DNA-binding transcriptional regulator YiaG
MAKRKYRSKAMEPIWEEAQANYRVGAISKERLRHYEEVCFIQEAPSAATSPTRTVQPVQVYAAQK